MKEKRLDFELMRLMAIFLVVFNHTQFRGYLLWQVAGDSRINCALSLIMAAVCKAAVPLFFMISGGLLLGKRESILSILKKRVLRMLLVLVIFSALVYINWIYYGLIEEPGVKDFVRRLWREGISTPYWYLYTYLGLMLLLPILQPAAQAIPDCGYQWLLLLQLVYYGLIRPVGALTGLGDMNPNLFSGLIGLSGPAGAQQMCGQAVFYLFLGYYFTFRFDWKRITAPKMIVGAIAAVLSVAASVLLTWRDHVLHGSDGQEFYACYLCVLVLFLFALCHKLSERCPPDGKLAGAFKTMGGLVFGAYLFEGIMRRGLENIYIWLEPKIHVIPACVAWVTAVVFAGMAVTWVLKKIPGLSKLL